MDRIEFVFSRPRFAGVIGAALLTVTGLVATGVLAGIQIGTERTSMPTIIFRPVEAPVLTAPVEEPHREEPHREEPHVDEHRFVLQAGSFLSDNEARTLAATLAKNDFPAEVIALKDAEGRTWSVVRTGPYGQRAEALQAAEGLGRLSRTQPILREEPAGRYNP